MATEEMTIKNPLMTPAHVAEKWGVSEQYVWDAVDNEASPLPFIYLGRGSPRKGRAGQRGLYRFRLEAVEAWERQRERAFRVQFDDRIREAPQVVGSSSLEPRTVLGQKGRIGPRKKG